MSFAYTIDDIIRTLGPAERQMRLRSTTNRGLSRSSWPCGCVVDVAEHGAPLVQWESCPDHTARGAALAPNSVANGSGGSLNGPLNAFSVCGKRLAVADAWTFDFFMAQLAACAAGDAQSERRELAQLFLRTLPEAVIRRRCNCGDTGCRTYFFVDAPSFGGDIEVLDFPTRPGDYFLIVYAPSRKLLSVELFIED